MLNFFERQDRSRAASRRLVWLFALAVAAIVCSVYISAKALMYVFDAQQATRYRRPPVFSWYDPAVFGWTAGITLCIVGIGALVRIRALAGGGGYVAERLGAKLVSPDTADPAEKRFLNVVEEMSIASGVPVPLVYVMDREESINAFAAGYEPAGAVVAVTRGCLARLTRDELQSVIAHEFSHILCGDMRLNIRLIGLLGGILSIATIGSILMRVRGKNSAPVVFAGLALLIIGYAGVFFGRIIQCAVSRQREFLADASAVQFTRNPLGLAGALKKIGGFSEGSRVLAPEAGETCHMFFASAISSLFATHPPLEKRIRLLDPGFSGKFPASVDEIPAEDFHQNAAVLRGFQGAQFSASAGQVAVSAGIVTPEHIDRGRNLMAGMPQRLKSALADPLGASATACCLLLDADPARRGEQIRLLRSSAEGKELVSELLRLAPMVAGLDAAMRLPALDLAVPGLRRLSPPQYQSLLKCLKLLIEADRKITLYEFCLYTIITRRLASAFSGAKPKQAELPRPEFLRCSAVLLSALARAGADSEERARDAFSAGAGKIKAGAEPFKLLSADEASVGHIGQALHRCAAASGSMKQELFEACSFCSLFDSAVTAGEAELLRAMAYCLDIPLPVFLPEAN